MQQHRNDFLSGALKIAAIFKVKKTGEKNLSFVPNPRTIPFRQRERIYRGLAIRWPQFARGVGRSRRNQRLLLFQHDILCTSAYSRNPGSHETDFRSTKAIRRSPNSKTLIPYGNVTCSIRHNIFRFAETDNNSN